MNEKELLVGSSEFLYSLRNVEMVLTDSFPAIVFSIIFLKSSSCSIDLD